MENTSFLANMDEAEKEAAKKAQGGQLMDGEEREEEGVRLLRGMKDGGMTG